MQTVWSRCLPALVAGACGLAWATGAEADCPVSSGLPQVMNYGSVAVPNSLATGSVIPGTERTFTVVGKCAASSMYDKPIVACPWSATEVPGMTGVYATNLAGVGMRMRDSSGRPLVGTGLCSPDTSVVAQTADDGSFSYSTSFELVKTGTVTSGILSNTSYRTGVYSTGVLLNNGANTVSADNTSVTAITCGVAPASVNPFITLASVSPSAFPAVGSAAARTQFSLSLTCQAKVAISVTFSSTSGSTGVAGVLGNTGTATSVGVQLLDAAQKPLPLDAPVLLTASSTTDPSFRFFAQYIRLGSAAVTAGTVHSTAIFTMSYQ